MKHTFSKRIVALFLALVMLCGLLPVMAFAAEGGSSTPTVVIAGSDFQAPGGDTEGVANVTAILTQMQEDYLSIDGFLFSGDYTNEYPTSGSALQPHLNQLKNTVEGFYGTDLHEVYVQGNHDQVTQGTGGLSGTGAHDPDSGKYGVYVIDEDDYQWYNNDASRIRTAADNLQTYLNGKVADGFTAPIFVVSHLPLHYSLRTKNDGDGKYAKYIFDVLQAGGQAGLNIIYLFGHDHSHGWDNYLGGACIYLPEGDSINIANEGSQSSYQAYNLAFTYMNAGYVGYYTDKGSGTTNTSGVDDTLTMSVFAITDTTVTVSRYSASGVHNLKARGVQNVEKDTGNTEVKNLTVYASPRTEQLNLQLAPVVKTPVSLAADIGDAKIFCTPDSVDLSNYTFTVTYDDDSTEELRADQVTVGTPTAARGADSVEVTYGDLSCTVSVTVLGAVSGTGVLTDSALVESAEPISDTTDIEACLPAAAEGFEWQIDAYDFTAADEYDGEDVILAMPVSSRRAVGYYYNEQTNALEELTGTTVRIAGGNYFVFTATHFSTYLTAEQKTGSTASSDWIEFPGSTETIYKLVDGPQANGDYVIATSNSAGSANAVSHNANGDKVDNEPVTVLGADTKSSVPYISSVDGKAVWTASSNTSFTLKNDSGYLCYPGWGKHLYYSNDYSSKWTYSKNKLSTSGVYLQNNDGEWATTRKANNATSVYFYEKTDLPATSTYVKASYTNGYTIALSDWTNETRNTIKNDITVQKANSASGAGATTVTDFTVDWSDVASAVGNYPAYIKYTANGKTSTLGTMTIHIVPDETVTFKSIDSYEGYVTVGSGSAAKTHSTVTLTVTPFNGASYDVTIPVTVNMLSGDFNTSVVGTYPNLTVTYSYGGQTFTQTGYTLIVNEKTPPNDYPQYPDPGSVKVDKSAVGVDFQSTGIAKVELSASGVPVDNGIDVIVMVDTSSSMKYDMAGNTSNVPEKDQRITALRASLTEMINSFKTPNEDGTIPDIRIAVADFNGYDGAQLSQSTDYFGTGSSNPRTGQNYGKVYTGSGEYNAGAFIQITADMGTSFIDSITTQSGTNYDYAFDSVYKLATAIQDANGENQRDLYVIFMSDGAPFQYNQYTANSSDANWNSWLKGTWESAQEVAESGVLKSTAHSYFYNGAGNKHRMAEAIKGDPDTTYEVISFDVNGNTGTPESLISINGLGAAMYSVGFCLADDSAITVDSMEYVLTNIASSPDKAYFVTQAAELTDAFNSIAHDLKYAATAAYFDDTMGEDFDLQLGTVNYTVNGTNKTIAPEIKVSLYNLYTANEVGTVVDGKTVTQEMVGTRKPGAPEVVETVTFNDVGTEAYSSALGSANILIDGVIRAKSFFYNTNAEAVQIDTNGDGNTDYDLPAETFYWNIGTLRRQEVVLSYYVCLTGSMVGKVSEGSYPTNKSATLYYSNWLGNDAKKVTVSPVMPWGGAQISYGFYLVNRDGVPVTNQTTGVTGSFADAVKLTSPVVASYINLNNSGNIDASVVASDVLPEGYMLFDSAAEYTLSINSDGTGSWTITGGSGITKDTTYVANYKSGAAATTQRTATDPSYDYTNTTVWFAVKYEIKCIPDAVVIDYGLPVDIDVLANDMFGANGKLEAIGAMGAVDPSQLNSTTFAAALPAGFVSEGKLTLAHGEASINGAKVRYTPTDMLLADAEQFVYAANCANARYQFGTVTVIPATSIYYEDSFVTFDGSWTTVGTAEDKTQAEDRPGAFSLGEFDANNVYGYDGAYSSYTTYSLGAAKKTTVSSSTNANPPTAKFTFTGTAFDVVSMTNSTTGTILVDVYQGTEASGTAINNWIVDTYYGYARTQDATNPFLKRTWTYGSDQAWHVVTEEVNEKPNNAATTLPEQPDTSKTYVVYEPNYTWTPTTSGDAIYQVPVLKSPTLAYGTYTVVIKPMYAEMFDHAKADSYEFYFDAVRVYDPAGKPTEGVVHDAYAADGELNPGYVEIRDLLIGADTFNAADGSTQVSGVVFIDGAGSVASVSDYKDYGPKNEVYLESNQAIAFQMTSSVKNPNVQIGAKAAGGSNAKLTVRSEMSSKGVTLTLNTATEMYYSLSSLGVIWTEQNGQYVSSPIIISNTGSSGIVSLTNIKAPGASINANEGVTLSAFDMVLDALIPTAYAADNMEYDLHIFCTTSGADKAIKVLEDEMMSAYEKQNHIRYDKPVLSPSMNVTSENTWQNPYVDITSGTWYYEYVKAVTEKSLMQGSGNKFDPNGKLTRAMLVTVLYRMSGETVQAAELPFADVDLNSWYGNAAAWAFEKGIIKGISATEFAPMQNVSRQDMAVMFARFAEAYGLNLQSADGTQFADDAQISDYAKNAVYSMKASGILSGRPNGMFDPKGTTTRAEAAKVLFLLAEME